MYNDPDQPQPPPYGGQPDWRQPQPPPPYGQPQWGQQTPPPPYAPAQYGSPPYGVPPVPGYTEPQPQPRQSNRWAWITLGILGGLIVLGLIGCVFLLCTETSSILSILPKVDRATQLLSETATAQTATAISTPGKAQTVQQYYTAIKAKDYVTAYSYVEYNLTITDGQTLTAQLFTQAAMARDSSLGQVTDFTVTADPNDSTQFTVSVTRGTSAPYTVNIQVMLVGSEWKISSYDNI